MARQTNGAPAPAAVAPELRPDHRRALAAALGVGALLTHASPAQGATGEIFIDRGRLDAPPLPAAQPAPTPAEQAPPAPAIGAAHEKLRAVHIAGEEDPRSLAEIAALLAPFQGQPITTGLLQRMIEAVSRHYAERGLALYRVFAPEQSFAGGHVRLVALQGRIAEIAVDGAGGKAGARLRRIARVLQTPAPLRTAQLQRALMLIDQTPGFAFAASFEPIAGDPTGVRLRLKGKARRFAYGAAVNNGGQELLGRTQFEVTALANSFALGGDQAQIFYGFPAAFDRYQFVALSYGAPLNADGLRLQANVSHLKTNPDGPSAEGEADTASIQASYPLHLSATNATYIFGGLDALWSRNALLGQTLSADRTRVLRVSLSHVRARKHATTSAGATLSFGLDAFGAQTTAPFGDPRFAKADARLTHDRRLGAHTRLVVSAFAQYAGEALPSSERFQFGGKTWGRGFPAASLSAERALAASAELRRTLTPAAAPLSFTLTAFVDGARLFHDDIVNVRDRTYSSAGAGAEFGLGGHAALAFVLAQPIAGGDGAGMRALVNLRTSL